VIGWVHDDATFSLAYYVSDWRYEDTIDVAPQPAWEDEDELVVRVRENLAKHIVAVRVDPPVVVIEVSSRNVLV